MEPFALLQTTPRGFGVLGTINSLVFGVFVACVVAAVFLFSVNRKLKRLCQLVEKGMAARTTSD